jgi:hypothetical protein
MFEALLESHSFCWEKRMKVWHPCGEPVTADGRWLRLLAVAEENGG